MSSYLARLRAIEKIPSTLNTSLTELPKPSCVSSGSAPLGVSQKFTVDDIALQHLWRLAAKYRSNLVAGGYDPANARVQLVDWRAECRLDVFTFHQILMRLVADGRVAHLHHHAWLAANYKPEETEI